MSNSIETYGKSVHTKFKLQLCKEYLKQTCLRPTDMVCVALSGGRSLRKIKDSIAHVVCCRSNGVYKHFVGYSALKYSTTVGGYTPHPRVHLYNVITIGNPTM